MKSKLVLLLLLTFLFFKSQAQNDLPKGSILPGGNVSFSSGKNELQPAQEQKSTAFSVSPSIGIAVRKNLFVGVSLGYSFSKNRNTNSFPTYLDSTRTNSFNYGVFVRKYKPLKHNLSIFLQGDLGGFNSHGRSVTNNVVTAYDSKLFGVNASLSPGISYGINSKLQLETGLNNIVAIQYGTSKTTDTGLTPYYNKSSYINISTSLTSFTSQLYVGFRLLLQKRNKPETSKAG